MSTPAAWPVYRVIRFRQNGKRRTIKSHLTTGIPASEKGDGMTTLREGITEIAKEFSENERHHMHEKYPNAPAQILDGIRDYADNRKSHGHFITAVLENNLSKAVCTADMFSLTGLADIVRYVLWEIPSVCHGSPAKVQAWLTGTEDTRAQDNEYYGEGGVLDAEEDQAVAERAHDQEGA